MRREEDIRTLQTVASIVINAMNLIENAKQQICDANPTIDGYFLKVHSDMAFSNAAEALREIPIAQLPEFEVVKPVLEMRDLIIQANNLLDQTYRHYVSGDGDWQEDINSFRTLHYRANKHTTRVEDVVRRIRDGF